MVSGEEMPAWRASVRAAVAPYRRVLSGIAVVLLAVDALNSWFDWELLGLHRSNSIGIGLIVGLIWFVFVAPTRQEIERVKLMRLVPRNEHLHRTRADKAVVLDPDLTEDKLAEFERFFSPIAPMLMAFAERHNLKVEKYRYAQANWSFNFRMAEYGSRGHLQVLRAGEQVMIAGSVDHLDLKNCRRLLSPGGMHPVTVRRDSPQVASALQEVLVRIATMSIEEMRSDGGDYSRWRGEREADAVRAGLAALPLVRMH